MMPHARKRSQWLGRRTGASGCEQGTESEGGRRGDLLLVERARVTLNCPTSTGVECTVDRRWGTEMAKKKKKKKKNKKNLVEMMLPLLL